MGKFHQKRIPKRNKNKYEKKFRSEKVSFVLFFSANV